MAHSDDTRRAVRAAFVFDQLGLEIAAVKNDVPVATARRWISEARKAGDDWEKARAAQMMAGGGVEAIARQTMAMFSQQAQATMLMLQSDTALSPLDRAKAMASLADSFTKLVSANGRLMPETDKLAVAMDVVKRLREFIQADYPQHGGAFAEVLMPFGEEIARAYG
jgi:hypothetical protein